MEARPWPAGAPRRERGVLLVFGVIALLLIAGLSAALLSLSLGGGKAAAAQEMNARAFHVAEAALDEAAMRLGRRFREGAFDPADPASCFRDLDDAESPGDASRSVFRDPYTSVLFQDLPLGPGTATVWLESDRADVRDGSGTIVGEARDVRLVSSGTVQGVTCSIQKSLRFQVAPSRKLELALLSEDSAACTFCHLEVRGDVGQSSPVPFKLWSAYDREGFARSAIHGDLYLAGLFSSTSQEASGASRGLRQERLVTDQGGAIHQRHQGEALSGRTDLRAAFEKDGWFDRRSRSESASIRLARAPARSLLQVLAEGTDGDRRARSYLGVVPRGGILTGLAGSATRVGPVVDGHLVLVGTPENPLVLDRSITVHGDVVIRGTVKGAGNILASGNIYIVGPLRYASPPTDPARSDSGAAGGGPADRLGLGSGSNILIGDPGDRKNARFLRTQLVDAQGSSYEYVPAAFLQNRFAFDGERGHGERGLSPRTAGGRSVETPGLLPEGTLGAGCTADGTLSYLGGWIPQSILYGLATSGIDRIDATLFAVHAIAGRQEPDPPLTILGGVVGGAVSILSAREGSGAGLRIIHDARNRAGNPLGLPPEAAVLETGWMRIPPQP